MISLLEKIKKMECKRVAIYGLSMETESVLKFISSSAQIVGLLDGHLDSGNKFGYPIKSLKDVITEKIDLIIVVARPSSCKIIVKRIEKVCRENGILLFDTKGYNLLEEKKIAYHLMNLKPIFFDELAQLAEKYDVISFDFFDTLFMRKTMFSTDIIEIVNETLKSKDIYIEDFVSKRVETEHDLSQKGSFTLFSIYRNMIEKYNIIEVGAEELSLLEWEIEQKFLAPRQVICDFLYQLKNSGKEIYIISDTYYTKDQIMLCLTEYNIDVTEVITSCEFQISKNQGLYKKYKDIIKHRNCLHIGDDEFADVQCAEKENIDTYRIYSALDIFDSLGYLSVWNFINNISDRIKIGLFLSKMFNSPFLFDEPNYDLCVKKDKDIGYLFVAPVLMDFILWFQKSLRNQGYQDVWLGARDGYLMKQLFELYDQDFLTEYFLTSRTAAVRAGIRNKNDIQYISEMNFQGDIKEKLYCRFGIEVETNDNSSLIDYSDLILKRAEKLRENYKKYIHKIHVKQNKIAFFDFVARGTTQFYLSKIVDYNMKGFYFMQLGGKDIKDCPINVESFYSCEEIERSDIYKDYNILETIITATDPSVLEFDVNGNPIYEKENRTKAEMECVEEIHQGVIQYFKDFLALCPNSEWRENKQLDEGLWRLIHKIQNPGDKFMSLRNVDSFFNRDNVVGDVL